MKSMKLLAILFLILSISLMMVSCKPETPDIGGDGSGETGGGETGGGENGGENGGESGGENGGESGGENGGESGGENGGENGGESGGESGGENGGENGGESGGENGGENGGESGGESGGENGGESGGENGGENGGESGGNQPTPTIYEISIYDDAGNYLKTVKTNEKGEYTLEEIAKTGYSFTGWFDSEDKAFSAGGSLSANAVVTAKYTLSQTTSFAELKQRLEAGVDKIHITQDISLSDTIYVTGVSVVYVNENCTLTRSPSFLGDLFVIGETPDGKSVIEVYGTNAKLTIKTENNSSLTIDGNKANISSDVFGSAFLIVNSSTLNINGGVTVQNFKKTANAKINSYAVSTPHKAGGAAVMVVNGTLNLNGAAILNNEVSLTDAVEGNTEIGISSCGGAIYNYGTVNINGAEISGNKAARGGAIYNYRDLTVKAAEFSANSAAIYGGAVYLANTQYGEFKIGSASVGYESFDVKFTNNCSELSGGAIFAQTKNSIVIYGSTLFEGNKSMKSNGGAINTSSALTVKDAVFKNNEAASKGGALYIYCASEELTVRQVSIEKGVFDSNKASKGGALACSASREDFTKGAIGYIGAVSFTGNLAYKTASDDPELSDGASSGGAEPGALIYNGKGGAVYLSRKAQLTMEGTVFKSNTAEDNGGALYVTSGSNLLASSITFEENKATGDKGGALYITTNAVASVTASSFKNNSAENFGGAVSVHSNSTLTLTTVSFISNAALKSHGGAVSVFSGSTVNISGSEFTSNTAVCITYDTDGVTVLETEGKGGAIHIQGSPDEGLSSYVNLNNVKFNLNKAGEHGGAVNLYQGGKLSALDCEFTQNETETANGGAIYSSGSAISLESTSLTSNTAKGSGGAIYLTSSTITAKDTLFKENSSSDDGGALYLTKSTTFEGDTPSADKFSSITFEKNKSSAKGGAIYATSGSKLYAEKLTLTANESTTNGGAITGGTDAVINIRGLTATANKSADGGVFYLTGASVTDLYEVSAIGNTASKKGGFIYVTTTNTTVNLHSKAATQDSLNPVRENTAASGNLIWSNLAKSTIGINFTNFPELRYDAATDADGVDKNEDGYSDEIDFKAKDTIEELS